MTLKSSLIAGLVIALLVPFGPPATAGTPATASTTTPASTTTYEIESLRADWISPGKNRRGLIPYMVVNATRRINVDTGEVVTSGVAGRGSCVKDSDGNFGCSVYFRSGWRVAAFETGEAFESATVRLRRRDKRARVTWTGGQPFAWTPPFAQNPSECPDGSEGTTTTVYVSGKNATAHGKVLGRRVSTAGEHDRERTAETMVQTRESEECP
jgi:hypothetical protein